MRRTYDHSARRRSDARYDAALARKCPKCNARPGARCWSRTSAGVAEYLHEERYEKGDGEPA